MLEDDEKETLKNDEKYKVLVEFKKLPAIQNLMGELYSCFHYLNASWNHLPEFIKYLDAADGVDRKNFTKVKEAFQVIYDSELIKELLLDYDRIRFSR